MPRYSSAKHRIVKSCEFDPAKGAERINDFILMSRGTSNGYLILTKEGDVAINTGAPHEGPRYRERYEQLLGRPLNVRKIIFTQDHFDHTGGWGAFADPGVETIAQRNYPFLVQERGALAAFFMPRGRAVLHAIIPTVPQMQNAQVAKRPPEPILFDDAYTFEHGGRRFELLSAPSGETTDAIMVWMPDEKIIFTGNWMGALYGALPHFYTLRGDRQRSIPRFMRDLQRLIDLKPELLITGHDEPIRGAERIHADMTKLLEAVRYIHDETIKGMNAQKDLPTLMRDVQLPAHLKMAPGRGPAHWYVRAVYEEYAGWFRQELTSELYATPPHAIWPELAAMAGGPDALVGRARARLDANAPEEALHFIEIAVAADARHRGARETEIAILEVLIDASEGWNFDELGWLETRIEAAKAALN